jgi:hypothetical protein
MFIGVVAWAVASQTSSCAPIKKKERERETLPINAKAAGKMRVKKAKVYA